MANRRMISSFLFEDDFFGELPRDIRLLWVGMICSAADDQGRIYESGALLRAKIFLYDKDIDDSFICKALKTLATGGKIIRYKKGGKPLLQIINWWDYQKPSWASASKFPPPDDWVDREKYHAKGNKIVKSNWDSIGGLHSELPSSVGSVIVKLREVKDKVKLRGDEVEVEKKPTTYDVEELLNTFTSKTSLEPGNGSILIATKLSRAGVIGEDISNAIDFLQNNPPNKCVAFKSVEKASVIEKNKRLGKKKEEQQEDYRRYIKGEYGDIGNH